MISTIETATSNNNFDEVILLDGVTVNFQAPAEKFSGFKEYTLRWLQGRVNQKSFLALQNVSLSIGKGEVFGLVGHNGAGKSTLLKLVARVMKPTKGRVLVKGQVAPLLELGAGFHPELTGRENIYLNGAILGFTSREMGEKVDRIIDFAELRDFIDAPMRTYSSGMWARLGFAVATDTKPDILIVDEILSVGDEAFQRKSKERIQQFQEKGTTILLVSHALGLIEASCTRAAWLDHGILQYVGQARDVISLYRQHDAMQESDNLKAVEKESQQPSQRWGSRQIEIVDVRITDSEGISKTIFETGEAINIEMDYYTHESIENPIFGLAVHRQDGLHITGPNTDFSGINMGRINNQGTVHYCVPELPLLEGLYWVSVAVVDKDNTVLDYHDRLYPFRVLNTGNRSKERYGIFTFRGHWDFRNRP